ncbi:hypothetical protein MMC21_002295 [Puttea exsequens]|nr:hypothetical protein [Puttea exsequens]
MVQIIDVEKLGRSTKYISALRVSPPDLRTIVFSSLWRIASTDLLSGITVVHPERKQQSLLIHISLRLIQNASFRRPKRRSSSGSTCTSSKTTSSGSATAVPRCKHGSSPSSKYSASTTSSARSSARNFWTDGLYSSVSSYSTLTTCYRELHLALFATLKLVPFDDRGSKPTLLSGVAVGSSIGHAIGGMFGSGSSAPAEQQQAENAVASQANNESNQNTSWGPRSCENDAKSFTSCLDQHQGNMQVCGWYLEQLKACQQAAKEY